MLKIRKWASDDLELVFKPICEGGTGWILYWYDDQSGEILFWFVCDLYYETNRTQAVEYKRLKLNKKSNGYSIDVEHETAMLPEEAVLVTDDHYEEIKAILGSIIEFEDEEPSAGLSMF